MLRGVDLGESERLAGDLERRYQALLEGPDDADVVIHRWRRGQHGRAQRAAPLRIAAFAGKARGDGHVVSRR